MGWWSESLLCCAMCCVRCVLRLEDVGWVWGCDAMMRESGCGVWCVWMMLMRMCGRGCVAVWLCVDVSLSHNVLGAEGGSAIAGALPHLTSLTTLEYVRSEGGV